MVTLNRFHTFLLTSARQLAPLVRARPLFSRFPSLAFYFINLRCFCIRLFFPFLFSLEINTTLTAILTRPRHATNACSIAPRWIKRHFAHSDKGKTKDRRNNERLLCSCIFDFGADDGECDDIPTVTRILRRVILRWLVIL